jgi:hypothetical protein
MDAKYGKNEKIKDANNSLIGKTAGKNYERNGQVGKG